MQSEKTDSPKTAIFTEVVGGDPINWELAQRVRAHQNFLEYVPMVLILMGVSELNGAGGTALITLVMAIYTIWISVA